MAISTYCNNGKIIDVAEFIDHVEAHIDIHDDDSVVSAAGQLQALANNKNALIEIFNRDLLRYDRTTGASYSQSSSIMGVGRNKSFVVRANMWPPAGGSSAKTIEDALFSYELPHDHNFSFLTANYFGPGYETDIWECEDPESIRGYVGEKVALRFLERTRLEPGKQIYFRRQRDVHVQHPPEDYSVSLNLLIVTKQDRVCDQFEFDVQDQTIAGFPEGTMASKRAFVMDMAGRIGNGNTAHILLDVAERHPCQRTRAAALSSALRIAPDAAAALAPAIKDDRSPFIQDILKTRV